MTSSSHSTTTTTTTTNNDHISPASSSSSCPPIHFSLHVITSSLLSQMKLPHRYGVMEAFDNGEFRDDGGLDYSLEGLPGMGSGGTTTTAATSHAAAAGPRNATSSSSRSTDNNNKNLPHHQIPLSSQITAKITKAKIQAYLTQFIHHLETICHNNNNRNPRDRIYAVVQFVKQQVPKRDLDLALRIVLEMERFGLMHVETMARRLSHNVLAAFMKNRRLASSSQSQSSSHPSTVAPGSSSPQRKRIIIIGAGPSGISAAIRLKQMGYKTLILEARHRVGGRVLSCERADMGATIMTAGINSPVFHWCKELKLNTHTIADKGPIYDSKGRHISLRFDTDIQQIFDKLLSRASSMTREELSQLLGGPVYNMRNVSLGHVLDKLLKQYVMQFQHKEERNRITKLLQWYTDNLEYGIGTELHKVSLTGWDVDDTFETKGHHFLIQGGVQQVFQRMVKVHDLDIRYGHEVKCVDYSDSDIVRITCASSEDFAENPRTNSMTHSHHDGSKNGEKYCSSFECQSVLVTVPLSVLKSNTINFMPALPHWKQRSIEKLGFGVLNKVILFFSEAFWKKTLPNHFYFGHVDGMGEDATNGTTQTKDFRSYMFWDVSKSAGRPCLMSIVPGKSALQIQNLSEEKIVEKISENLRHIFGEEAQKPETYYITNWGSDPYSGGCYAYVARDCFGLPEYEILARTVDQRIFFAGEHTLGFYTATVLGAVLSGMREAGKIDIHLSNCRRGDGSKFEDNEEEMLSTSARLKNLLNMM